MRNVLTILLAAAAVLPNAAAAQAPAACATKSSARGGSTSTVQPSIIVIPFTKEGEDMRTILESDVTRRIAVTKIKEGFDQLGFSTVDLRAVINAVKTMSAMTVTAQTDIKTQIIEQSRADIYVEAEVMEPQPTGDLLSASVIRTAYLTANGTSLANKIGHSGRFRGVEHARLVERAAADSLDAFLAMMQEKFDGIVEDGAIIVVDISAREGARNTLASAVGPNQETVAELLESWFEANAWKGNYNVAGSSDVRMILDAVRIPLRDPKTCNNYNASRFSREIITYLRSINVQARPTIERGRIFIELQ